MRNSKDEIRVGVCSARFDIITSRWMITGHAPTSNPLKAQRYAEHQNNKTKPPAGCQGFHLLSD